ncbi:MULTISPECIES: TonB-dependent receptor [unclassified Iodidimonas]|jgi:iron complex outermembrane receptor protein|uniref:TonB-dependent receptor domain-containing protein n=1 Tax=unclassified Iodidimonas TaxID=2626145 RepID=UPI0024824153|nr:MULTISPECIES: TonB-dependent receptor [unclassified Iodidimonas]
MAHVLWHAPKLRTLLLSTALTSLGSLGSLSALPLLAPASAIAAEAHQFNIPAQPLDSALIDFSLQAGVSVLVSDDLIRDQRSNEIAGRLEQDVALKTLLGESGLTFERVDETTISIKAITISAAEDDHRRLYAQANAGNDANMLQRPDDRSAQPRVLEQISVTARRRAESLLDVPIAVSAFTGDALDRLGTVDITGLNQLVPNVTIEVSRGTNTTLTPFIRGVGQQDPVAGFEQGVGLYVDDVYLNRPQGAVLDLYDIERVEVLRGPQGTLYGRNTIGGAIKYVTKRIADEPEFSVRASGGSFRQIDFVGTFSLPVTETFRMGGTVASFKRDGFGDNLNLEGLENGSKDILGGRLSAEWTPTSDLYIRLAADWTDDNSDPRQGARLTPGLLSGAPVLDNVFDTRAGLNDPEANVVNRGVSGLIEYTINDRLMLKSITAYRDNKSSLPEDFDSLPAADVDVALITRDDQFSEELQLLYNSQRLNGVLGFFYMDATAFNAFDVILGTTGDLLGLPGLNAFTLGDVDTETWSIFGDFTYDITTNLALSVGGRFTSDQRTARINRSTFLGGASPLLGGPDRAPIATATDFNGSETFHDFTPRASLNWKPTNDHMLYFSFSQGFKGGGFDPRGSGAAAPDLDGDGIAGADDPDDVKEFLMFKPEEITTYEIGHKGTMLNGRLSSSIAAFWSTYDDIQIPGSVGVDADNDGIAESFVGITSNAGEARIRGIELEFDAILAENLLASGDHLNATAAVGYIDAEFQEFINAFGQDIADQATFQNTPEWTANVRLDYSRPLKLFGASGTLSFLPVASYRSTTNQFEVSSNQLDQEGYVLFDMSIVWTSDDDRWQVGVHGKNLTDKEYIVSGFDFVNDETLAPELGLEGTLTAFFGNPRTFTGTVRMKF